MKRIRERNLAVRFLFFALVAGLCLAAKAMLPGPVDDAGCATPDRLTSANWTATC